MSSERIYSNEEESLQFEPQRSDEYDSLHTQEEDKEVRLRKLLEIGEKKGSVTSKNVAGVFPEVEQEEPDLDLMDEIFIRLNDVGIDYEGQVDETGPIGKKLSPTKKNGDDDEFSNVDVDDSIGLYMKEVRRIPLLTAGQEVELAKRIERGRKASEEMARGTPTPQEIAKLRPLIEDGWAAREHLTTANSRLVISVAKKYKERGVPFLDLVQEGNIGLIRAAKKFEYERGLKFSTYATWWIRQAVVRSISDQGRTIRVPVHMSDQINRMQRTTHQLTQNLGREPTIEEVAEILQLEPKNVENMIQIARRPISLEEPIGEEEDSLVGDFIEDEDAELPDDKTIKKLLREQLNDALHTLPPREARVMRLRSGLEDGQSYTLEEVGRKMGVTRERVRQIEAQALRRLKDPLIRRKLVDYHQE